MYLCAVEGLLLPNMSSDDMCRLCALPVTRLIPVFGEEGKKVNLDHKLRTCCPITVRETDTFPKQVCLGCLMELEKVYEFHEKVKLAQLSLKAQQSRKRQLSETGGISKRFQFGSTILSNLTKSFDVPNSNTELTASLEASLPPLSVSINTEEEPPAPRSSPRKAFGRPGGKLLGPRSVRKVKPEPLSPVRTLVKTPVETPVKNPEPPNIIQASASPPSPASSKEKDLSKKSPSSSMDTDTSDANLFRHCKYCQRKFLLKDYLQHEALHKGGTVFICDQCNKSFITEMAYKRHVERHQTK